MIPTPRLPLTVPRDIWDDLAEQMGGPFADSYLSGAEVGTRRILPRTKTAWDRLRDTPAALAVFQKHGLQLIEPPLFKG